MRDSARRRASFVPAIRKSRDIIRVQHIRCESAESRHVDTANVIYPAVRCAQRLFSPASAMRAHFRTRSFVREALFVLAAARRASAACFQNGIHATTVMANGQHRD